MDPPDAPDDLRRDAGGGTLEMEPSGSDDLDDAGAEGGGGTLELRPLVARPRYSGPKDAPEDDAIVPAAAAPSPSSSSAAQTKVLRSTELPVAEEDAGNVAWSKTAAVDGGANPNVEAVASMLSNEGIINGIQRLTVLAQQGYVMVRDKAAEYQASRASDNGTAASTTTVATTGGSDVTSTEYDNVESSETKKKKMFLLLLITLFVALMGAVLNKFSALQAEEILEEGDSENAFHDPSKAGGAAVDIPVKKAVHIINVEGYQPTEMVNSSESNFLLPTHEDAYPLTAVKGRPYFPILNHFQHRDPKSSYAEKWGYFDFQDPDPKWDGTMRPQPDFVNAPNRDVKNSEFPEGAWQKDKAYMEAFLSEAKLLVNRSMEAVYAEYGVGIPPDGSITLTEEQMVNREKFFPFILKPSIATPGGGSWSTKKSFEGLARRIIHHVMTGDTFKLTLGGHSAAAGHGAGFNQSYIIEAGHVLEPVFAHLGVEFRAYNFAQGGMGTFQQSLAGMDLRGKETDWIMWDSKMTEKQGYLNNFFLRQALISGNRAPVLMGDGVELTQFHEVAGAGVANQGNGWVPVTMTDAQVKSVPWAAQWLQCGRGATTDCKRHEYTAGCWVNRPGYKPYMGQMGVVGGAASWHPGNRIHKRRGRMIALIVLKSIEYALNKWETLGSDSGYPIPEDQWHVTDYYKNIREKATKVGGCWGNNWRIGQKRRLEEIEANNATAADDGRRLDDNGLGHEGFWPARLCNLPLQGRSGWGPRNDPMKTSLLAIMRPNPKGDLEPGNRKTAVYRSRACYDPPDLPAPWTVPPATEPFAPLIGASRRLDVVEAEEEVEGRKLLRKGEDERNLFGKAKGAISSVFYNSAWEGRRLLREGEDERSLFGKAKDAISSVFHKSETTRVLAEDDAAAAPAAAAPTVDANGKILDNNAIIPGYGIQYKWGRPGHCDGSSHSWCDKPCDSSCLMGGAQDNRGMVCFDGMSGWVVFDIKNVKHGFIGARMEPWHGVEETHITAQWTKPNNGGLGNYKKRGRERELHEEYQQQMADEATERMKKEIEDDIQCEDDPERCDSRRLGGGQSCGVGGDYTFEFAINGTRTAWTKAQFCAHFTRLNYNLDVIKMMDNATMTGDFELAMRMTKTGRTPMCITHLYWS